MVLFWWKTRKKLFHLWEIFISCLLHLWEIRCYICGKLFYYTCGNFITLVGIITVVGNFITLVRVITPSKFYYTCGSDRVSCTWSAPANIFRLISCSNKWKILRFVQKRWEISKAFTLALRSDGKVLELCSSCLVWEIFLY